MTGTWCTDELNLALDNGYKMVKIMEVYHWPESMQYDKENGQKGLFTDYVSKFLRCKLGSSGFPEDVITDAQKEAFIQQIYTNYGFMMDKSEFVKNEGLRLVAKLKLNR